MLAIRAGCDVFVTQIERFFRACGISCGEAPLFSVSGFVADLLEAIQQSQSRVIGRIERMAATSKHFPRSQRHVSLNRMIGFCSEVGKLASLSARAEPADSVSKERPA